MCEQTFLARTKKCSKLIWVNNTVLEVSENQFCP